MSSGGGGGGGGGGSEAARRPEQQHHLHHQAEGQQQVEPAAAEGGETTGEPAPTTAAAVAAAAATAAAAAAAAAATATAAAAATTTIAARGGLEIALVAIKQCACTSLTALEHQLLFWRVLHALKCNIGLREGLEDELFLKTFETRLCRGRPPTSWREFHTFVVKKWGRRDEDEQPNKSLVEIEESLTKLNSGKYMPRPIKMGHAVKILAYLATLFSWKKVPLREDAPGCPSCSCGGHGSFMCKSCNGTGMDDAATACPICDGNRMGVCEKCVDTYPKY